MLFQGSLNHSVLVCHAVLCNLAFLSIFSMSPNCMHTMLVRSSCSKLLKMISIMHVTILVVVTDLELYSNPCE